MSEQQQLSPGRIMDMASVFFESAALFAASDLGVFKQLAGSDGMALESLADALTLDPHGLRLLLDACVAVELLTKSADGQYRNAPDTEAFLVPGKRGDLSKAIRYNRDVYDAWGHLAELARTGKPVERPELHLGDDPNRTRDFVLAMHGRALAMAPLVIPSLDLAGRLIRNRFSGGTGTPRWNRSEGALSWGDFHGEKGSKPSRRCQLLAKTGCERNQAVDETDS